MRIAISAQGDEGLESRVSGSFFHCPFFVLIEFEEGRVTRSESLSNPYCGVAQPEDVLAFIHRQGADVLLSDGLDSRAITWLSQQGIEVELVASGKVGRALESYLNGDVCDGVICQVEENPPEPPSTPATSLWKKGPARYERLRRVR
jgi:predicted Fe-Mo cluster-binding NifX family protein